MMKKSLLAAALLGIVAASGAQAAAPSKPVPTPDTLTVTFQGEAKSPTCTVTVGNNNNLSLGSLSLTKDAVSAPVAVDFKVSNCAHKTVNTIEFNGGIHGETGKSGELKTGQDNVKVQISRSNKFDDIGSLTASKVNSWTDKADAISYTPFYARLKATGTAQSGKLEATGRFTVTYQ